MRQILVIDDDAGQRKLLVDLFSIRGFEVTTVRDGLEGLAALAGATFDAVLVDLMMPGKSGTPLLEEICSLYPEYRRRILVLSGVADYEAEAIRDQGWTIVSKPYELGELLAAVKQMTGEPERLPSGRSFPRAKQALAND